MLPILRYTLFAVLIGLQALTMIGVLASARNNAESVTREHARIVMQHLSDNAANNTRRFLAPAERSVRLTQQLIEQGVLETQNPGRLEQYFLAQLRSNPQMAGMYLAKPDGEFLFVKRQNDGFLTKTIRVAGERSVELVGRDTNLVLRSRTLDPADRYDPRTRPWFKTAVRSSQPIWTGPYVFFTSKTPGITTAVSIKKPDGSLRGVVGADIEITGLSEFLGHVPISKNGAAFIMDLEGQAISFPGIENALRQNPTARALPMLTAVGGGEVHDLLETYHQHPTNTHQLLEYTIDRTKKYGMMTPFSIGGGTPWMIGVHAPADDFTGTIQSYDQALVLNVLGIGLLACLLAVPIAFGLTRPLNVLHHQATIDPLTGLLNRAEFMQRAKTMLETARKHNQPITVAMLDLDGFKAVNDRYGHPIGDAVLTAASQRIQTAVRERDLVGRIGGDEFALVLPGMTAKEATVLIERVRAIINHEPIISSAGHHMIDATVGVAFVSDDSSIEDVLGLADQALLRGKDAGKSRSLVYAI
jgi:diguanylate cyclase (GGDEF)-like protein